MVPIILWELDAYQILAVLSFFYNSKEEVIKILCFMSGKLLFFNYSLYVLSSVLEHFETVIKK